TPSSFFNLDAGGFMTPPRFRFPSSSAPPRGNHLFSPLFGFNALLELGLIRIAIAIGIDAFRFRRVLPVGVVSISIAIPISIWMSQHERGVQTQSAGNAGEAAQVAYMGQCTQKCGKRSISRYKTSAFYPRLIPSAYSHS
ncbi:MAG: hypothetical protein PHV28_12125, partial [Kiritimatiellae bacterium]|nr:hypothetical protein [Kiritimatiellia bacterium]